MFFNNWAPKKSSPYDVYDGYSLWLVRVPFGLALKTNGEVIAECSAPRTDEYFEWVAEKALFKLHECPHCSKCGKLLK